MNRNLVILLLVLALGIAVAAGAFLTGSRPLAQSTAMTELNISNLTCGSCVSKVQTALAKTEGVDHVEVSVTNGRGQMTYDPSLISAAKIADIVTEAGYPARVRLDLSAADYQKTLTENEQLSAQYIARIGKRLLSRAEFDQLVTLRAAASDLAGSATPNANQQIRTQVWQEMKEHEILLAAADKNRILVQDGEVSLEIERMTAGIPEFDTSIKSRFGSYERFFNQVKEGMIINRNIEQHVVAGLENERDKQLRFSQWYNETEKNTEILIFDAALKQASTSGSGCGGSCCG